MQFSWTSLIRLVGIVGVFVCLLAVGLGWLAPVPVRYRMVVGPAYGVINGFVIDPFPSESRLLNPTTGEISRFHAPRGDQFDHASCSPWQNEEGECQLVGRWARRVEGSGRMVAEEFGLARYSIPSGRVLDEIPLEVVPSSSPCWFPGTSARVLYAGSDGRLYQVSFEDEPGFADNEVDDSPHRPSPIAWHAPPLRHLMIHDPAWSTDPRLGGLLIAALAFQVHPTDDRLTPKRLWWLKLADDATVVDAGPLTDPEEKPRLDRAEERYPNVHVAPDGRLVLAYLSQPPMSALWELRLATVQIDPKRGIPMVHTIDDRVLASNHLGAQPSFSADGLDVFGVLQGSEHPHGPGPLARVVRFPAMPSSSRTSAGATAHADHKSVNPRG